MRNDLDLTISLWLDLYRIAQITNTSVNLYLVVQEFLESCNIEDLVGSGLGCVDHKLRWLISAITSRGSRRAYLFCDLRGLAFCAGRAGCGFLWGRWLADFLDLKGKRSC